MSLVSEALKKAEREASARDAQARGAPAPFVAPLQPYRARGGGRRRRLLVSALALFASATAIAIALLLFRPTGEEEAPVKGKTATAARALPLAPPAAPPAAAPVAAPVAAPATTAVANPFARPQPGARPDESSTPGPGSPSPRTAPSASEPMAPPLATPPLPKTALRPPPPSPSGSEPEAAKPPAAPAKARSNGSGDYLRSVEFADGSRLELGGIVYSAASPFAYLNGRLVGVGEFVLGRRIDRIERDRVILSGEGGEIILRLKAP